MKKIIYLDYAATTPVDPLVVKAMEPYWNEQFGNPASLYKIGQTGSSTTSQARKTIAEILHCSPKEIIFTSGGTESINLAIFGIARQYELANKRKGHIITTSIEHHAVLNSVQALIEEGWKVSYAPVDKEGFIKLDALKKLVRPDTVLISVMYANNEIGTIEPIEQIGRWLNGLNKTRKSRIYFHTDACQAAGSLDLNVNNLRVDLMTINASKIYGPKGIGLLYLKSDVKIRPLIFGGGQEQNLRSGTENVPAIIGFAKAIEINEKNKSKEIKRLLDLQKYFWNKINKSIKNISLNGPNLGERRLPNNINLLFENIEGEALMLYLDAKGVEVSTGSACATTSLDPSHVLEAIGIKRKDAYNALRITLGKQTTKADLDYTINAFKDSVNLIQKAA